MDFASLTLAIKNMRIEAWPVVDLANPVTPYTNNEIDISYKVNTGLSEFSIMVNTRQYSKDGKRMVNIKTETEYVYTGIENISSHTQDANITGLFMELSFGAVNAHRMVVFDRNCEIPEFNYPFPAMRGIASFRNEVRNGLSATMN